MYPSQLRELHPSVDYEWIRRVVAASLLESAASDHIRGSASPRGRRVQFAAEDSGHYNS